MCVANLVFSVHQTQALALYQLCLPSPHLPDTQRPHIQARVAVLTHAAALERRRTHLQSKLEGLDAASPKRAKLVAAADDAFAGDTEVFLLCVLLSCFVWFML